MRLHWSGFHRVHLKTFNFRSLFYFRDREDKLLQKLAAYFIMQTKRKFNALNLATNPFAIVKTSDESMYFVTKFVMC